MEFNHFDSSGNAAMVDVSDKEITSRTAIARGTIKVGGKALSALKTGLAKKGDVLAVARVAGIMAVKRTSDLIPMTHPLAVTKCSIDFETDEGSNTISALCTVKTDGKTGVEMEALTGVSVALLTIYDMCKAISKDMEIGGIHLVKKTGGKSGDFRFEEKDS